MQYVKPDTVADAVGLLKQNPGSARVMAGGTDLLVQMKSGMVEPGMVIDIKGLPGSNEIKAEDGGMRVGAGVSGAALGEHEAFCKMWPGVAEAFQLIGSTQVQGRATMAGNLMNASPAADSVPAMVAANAVARIEGPDGQRDCAVGDIPAGPGKTTLKAGEFISSIFFPAKADNASDAYLRFIPRTEMDIAVASAGVSLQLDGNGNVTAARVALGAVAPTVVLVEDAAAALVGSKLDDAALDAMAAACSAACNPIDDKRGTVEFRTKVAGVMARRAAKIAYERAGGAK